MVLAGLTERVPVDGTDPIPPEMLTESALSTPQTRLALCPAMIEVGSTAKLRIAGASLAGGGGASGVGAEGVLTATGAGFLQPTEKIDSESASSATLICLRDMG